MVAAWLRAVLKSLPNKVMPRPAEAANMTEEYLRPELVSRLHNVKSADGEQYRGEERERERERERDTASNLFRKSCRFKLKIRFVCRYNYCGAMNITTSLDMCMGIRFDI